MIDSINAVMVKLIMAETSEPMLLTNPPQQTYAALLYKEARSVLREAKGRNNDLLDANTQYVLRARTSESLLSKLLEHYISLANSGDAGNWNCEEEELIIEIKTYLANGPWNLSVY
jgi:hypothetical protein